MIDPWEFTCPQLNSFCSEPEQFYILSHSVHFNSLLIYSIKFSFISWARIIFSYFNSFAWTVAEIIIAEQIKARKRDELLFSKKYTLLRRKREKKWNEKGKKEFQIPSKTVVLIFFCFVCFFTLNSSVHSFYKNNT